MGFVYSPGKLQTDNDKIEECLFSVFFEARHLTDSNFDDHFYQEVNNLYNQIINEDPPDEADENVMNLNSEITIQELQKAIKANGKSVDNFNFHPVMFKHLSDTALAIILRIFNMCLRSHMWIWEGAEVIFLRKDGKDNYSKPGSYRPICITSYIVKLFEAIIQQMLIKKASLNLRTLLDT